MAERKAPKVKHPLDPVSEAWNKLPWRKLEQHVYRIQKRIYRANQSGNKRTVQKLQKLLMKSQAARLLAVRRVTQDNQGKKTAGVDGVKSVQPAQRLNLVRRIHPHHWKHQKPKPVRRVWIPKPGKAEKRPLGIPTMLERSKQALAKMALEPEWEAVFEPNSYGFRPGRSCHDAIEAIFNAIKSKPKFVFDADIQGCFDAINQEALVEKLHTYPSMRNAIKAWLKAGVLEGGAWTATKTGTPQGGVISPLLANIALHGMEEAISDGYKPAGEKPILVRYADDFVIVHSEREELQKAIATITHWLGHMGLNFSPKKTRVTHTLTSTEGKGGFDFLGFTVRQFPVGKTHTGKNTHGKPLGFKTIIRPSKEAVKRHMAETKKRIRKLRSTPQDGVIQVLNPVIRGWAAYYRTVVSSHIFKRCDSILWHQLWSWAKWGNPKSSGRQVESHYWHRIKNRKVFSTPKGLRIWEHAMVTTQRHTKVKGNASPYDGNRLYWSQRLKHHPLLNETKAKLLQKQQGKCRWCGLTFKDEDVMETDHIDRNRNNKALSNTILLHRHCHDERHAKFVDTEKISRLAAAGIHIK